MITQLRRIELLAPAKDYECGKVAVDCGADAVYIGASNFGARENASNSLEDLSKLIDYAHKYWAKVYVTLNTLLHEHEIEQALEIVQAVYDMQADALIIQDTGLLECELPPIPLIASTQMHNNTPERVAFLGKVGFKRAILARELSLQEIKAIRQATDIELECFVHGALCVSYSGQCYMSYSLGARSGNRGQCAQPCRRTYDLVDSNGRTLVNNKHLLSLKDLNLIGQLEDLLEAGVSAFKIEGRLKDKSYVANVTSAYRSELDRLIAKHGLVHASSGTSAPDFVPDLGKTFNRGYTTGCLPGRSTSKMANIYTPKMIGEYVGTVLSVQGRTMKLDRDKGFHPGDGVCFFGPDRELKGTVVNEVKGDLITLDKPHGVREHMQIFRNHDHQFLQSLANTRTTRKIAVSIAVSQSSAGLTATVIDEDQVRADHSIECALELAQQPEKALENIRKQLSKTGETEFKCEEVRIDLPEAFFVPISVLNTLRRDLLEKLREARSLARPVDSAGVLVNNQPFLQTELDYTGNVLNTRAEKFYRRHGVQKISPAAESGTDLAGKQVMRNRYCIKHQLEYCSKYGGKDVPGSLYLIDSENNRFRLVFDCANCEMEVHLISRAD